MSQVIEQNVPLSASHLWQAQRDFFNKKGIHAWQQVPYFVTSNAFVGDRYARLMLAYLEDQVNLGNLNLSEPLYLFELGTGSGQFSFYCQTVLQTLCATHPILHALHYCYVMTDFTHSNLDFWKTHSRFQPFLKAGKMDYALFDLEHPTPLFLEHQQTTLHTFKNPVILVGNYIFDSIRHDLFKVSEGVLEASLLETSCPDGDYDAATGTILSLENISFRYQQKPIASTDYPPSIAKILEYYQENLKEGEFSISTSGIAMLDFFMQSAPGLFMLSSDKGLNSLPELERKHSRSLVFHGSFSFDVNFNALAQHMRFSGGTALMQSYRDGIKTNLFLSHNDPMPHLTNAYQQYIEGFAPADYFRYHSHIKALEKLDLNLLLTQLSLGCDDPYVFSLFIKPVCDQIKTASTLLQDAYRALIKRLHTHIYPMPLGTDHYFNLGFFLHTLNDYAEALPYYQDSLLHHGERFDTLFNIGLCQYMTENDKAARIHFEKARLLATGDSIAQVDTWLDKVKAAPL